MDKTHEAIKAALIRLQELEREFSELILEIAELQSLTSKKVFKVEVL